MKKKMIIVVFVLMSVFFIKPIDTRASEINLNNNNGVSLMKSSSFFYIMDESYDQPQNCEGKADSLFGDPKDPESVAWLLQKILDYIKIIGPILVVILSSVDFITVIIKGDDEAMTKAQKKLIKRLILAALLFFIPVIIQAILSIFGMSAASTCGIQ